MLYRRHTAGLFILRSAEKDCRIECDLRCLVKLPIPARLLSILQTAVEMCSNAQVNFVDMLKEALHDGAMQARPRMRNS